MSKGFVLLAQNNDTDDYVRMAYALALSLRLSQRDLVSISLITNEKLSDKVKAAFDNIIPITEDAAANSTWKIENRYKIYELSPYDETIVLDTDMLVFSDISHYWDLLSQYNIYFTSNVLTYRGEIITDNSYRRAFSNNNLPNLYTGLHYFKKSDEAEVFYNWMKLITKNWEEFYNRCLTRSCPSMPSMDVTAALAAKILNCENSITNNSISFIHMKPAIQQWRLVPSEWLSVVGTYYNQNNKLKVGNFLQDGIFHYTEKKFLTNDIVEQMEQSWIS